MSLPLSTHKSLLSPVPAHSPSLFIFLLLSHHIRFSLLSLSISLFLPPSLHPAVLLPLPLSPSHTLTPAALSVSLARVLTWPGADLVVIEVDVISAGDRRVLSLLSALAALLLLHLPLLWGHNSTGSPPGPQRLPGRAANSLLLLLLSSSSSEFNRYVLYITSPVSLNFRIK